MDARSVQFCSACPMCCKPHIFHTFLNYKLNFCQGTWTMEDTEDTDSFHSVIWIFMFLYINWIFLVSVIVGVIGNCLICYVVISDKVMHKPIYYYLINLAVCDTLNCIVWFLVIIDFGIISLE